MHSTGKTFTSNSCALLSLFATYSQVGREKLTVEGVNSQVRIPFFTGQIERVIDQYIINGIELLVA